MAFNGNQRDAVPPSNMSLAVCGHRPTGIMILVGVQALIHGSEAHMPKKVTERCTGELEGPHVVDGVPD